MALCLIFLVLVKIYRGINIFYPTDTAVFLQGFCNGKKGHFQTVETSRDGHGAILDVAIDNREKLFYTKTNGECIVMDVNTGQDFKVEICDERSEAAGPRFLKVSAGDMYTVAVTGNIQMTIDRAEYTIVITLCIRRYLDKLHNLYISD